MALDVRILASAVRYLVHLPDGSERASLTGWLDALKGGGERGARCFGNTRIASVGPFQIVYELDGGEALVLLIERRERRIVARRRPEAKAEGAG